MNRVSYRMCIACRRREKKNQLIRVVKTKEKDIILDLDSKSKDNGRSVYICKSKDCINIVSKKKLIARAFSLKTSCDDLYERLQEFLENEKQD